MKNKSQEEVIFYQVCHNVFAKDRLTMEEARELQFIGVRIYDKFDIKDIQAGKITAEMFKNAFPFQLNIPIPKNELNEACKKFVIEFGKSLNIDKLLDWLNGKIIKIVKMLKTALQKTLSMFVVKRSYLIFDDWSYNCIMEKSNYMTNHGGKIAGQKKSKMLICTLKKKLKTYRQYGA